MKKNKRGQVAFGIGVVVFVIIIFTLMLGFDTVEPGNIGIKVKYLI